MAPISKAQEYRARAEECRRQAEKCTTEIEKKQWESMADEWPTMSLSGGGANSTNGKPPMTMLTLRYIKGDFLVTGPDIEPMVFKSRREAKDWCEAHHPGSPVKEKFRRPREDLHESA
jgi:hypothetical protein